MLNQLRIILLVMVFAVALVGCGEDSEGGKAPAGTTPEDLAFCERWKSAVASGDDASFDAILADAPAAIEKPAAVVRAADPSGPGSEEVDAASAEIHTWTELHCQTDGRRLAPPIDATPDGVTFCNTSSIPPPPTDDRSGMVLYGESRSADPYDGPMLGLLWSPAEDGGHAGDGHGRQVTVRGRAGFANPITVFQQTILPDLGTVIAWTEGDRAFGLYGRKWALDRASVLVAIADRIAKAGGVFGIPPRALPAGFGQVFSGNPSVTTLIAQVYARYSVHYQKAGSPLELSVLDMTEDEFNAFRFFTVGVDQAEVAGRAVLAGNAWHGNGPAVVTWREPDGLVVRIVGIGALLDEARAVAAATRELTDEEWEALVNTKNSCRHP